MQTNQLAIPSLQNELKAELTQFLANQSSLIHPDEQLKIDLHCHDYNSDVPDELLGRMLNLPETWLATDKLIETLKDKSDLTISKYR